MPYVRDEEAMFDTGDEELFEGLLGDDEEKWEEEAVFPRYRRGAVKLPLQRRPFRPISGATGANIQTPAGRAQIQFPKPVATQEAVNALARELKGEIASLAASITKVNQTLDSNTAIVDKKISAVSTSLTKGQDQNQMMMLLPLLLSQPPKLTKITLLATDAPEGTKAVSYDVKEQEAKKDNSTLLLVLMMTMMGKGGGGGGSDPNMMMMLPLLLLDGGLK